MRGVRSLAWAAHGTASFRSPFARLVNDVDGYRTKPANIDDLYAAFYAAQTAAIQDQVGPFSYPPPAPYRTMSAAPPVDTGR